MQHRSRQDVRVLSAFLAGSLTSGSGAISSGLSAPPFTGTSTVLTGPPAYREYVTRSVCWGGRDGSPSARGVG